MKDENQETKMGWEDIIPKLIEGLEEEVFEKVKPEERERLTKSLERWYKLCFQPIINEEQEKGRVTAITLYNFLLKQEKIYWGGWLGN